MRQPRRGRRRSAAGGGPAAGQRWLCLGVGGAAAALALMLLLRLVFALHPASGRSGPGCSAEDGGCARLECGPEAADADGGAPAALREFLRDSEYLEACGEIGAEGNESVDPEGQPEDNAGGEAGGLRLLTIRDAAFPDDALARGWLPPSLRPAELQLLRCGLRELRAGAFESAAFSRLSALELRGNFIASLGPGAFLGLDALRSLVIADNPALAAVHPATVLPLATGLRSLAVHATLAGPALLRALLGAAPLTHLVALDLEVNNLGDLPADALNGLVAVETVNLRHCNLDSVEDGAFRVAGKTITELRLGHNNIRTLPGSTFTDLERSPRLELTWNPWHCVCSFAWVKLAVERAPDSDPGRCQTPQRNAGLPMMETDFCSEEEDSEEAEEVQIQCTEATEVRRQRREVTPGALTVPAGNPGFTVARVAGDCVEIHLEEGGRDELVYWYPEEGPASADAGCVRATRGVTVVVADGLRSRTDYVICLANGTAKEVVPWRGGLLHCVAVRTAGPGEKARGPAVTPAPAGRQGTIFLATIFVLVTLLVAMTAFVAYAFLFRGRLTGTAAPASTPVPSPRLGKPRRDSGSGLPERKIFWITARRHSCGV